jgi:hypothetical protein
MEHEHYNMVERTTSAPSTATSAKNWLLSI